MNLGTRPRGKSAVLWHQLRIEARDAGLPIVCVTCRQPHDGPPARGACGCGSYLFRVQTPAAAQPGLDFHAGEQ